MSVRAAWSDSTSGLVRAADSSSRVPRSRGWPHGTGAICPSHLSFTAARNADVRRLFAQAWVGLTPGADFRGNGSSSAGQPYVPLFENGDLGISATFGVSVI